MMRFGVSVLILGFFAPLAFGQTATRDLPPAYGNGVYGFTVSIAINPPPNVAAAGFEDRPPREWTVSNISNGGALDVVTGKVKWGPFFGSIPTLVTYDISLPTSSHGRSCFAGRVSFDGLDYPISGDQCVGGPVPTVSQWGLLALTLCLLTAGTIVLRNGLTARGTPLGPSC